MMKPSLPTRTRAPREVRRAQILEAALKCFSESGYHQASMDDLVRASGLSKGSLYWHFESKEEVFLALFDSFAEAYFAGWEALDDGERPLLDVISGGGELAFRTFLGEAGMMRAWIEFIAHPAARDRLADLYRRSREELGDLLERAMARGELKRLPTARASTLLIGMIEGILLQAFVDDEFDPLAQWPGVVSILKGGLVG